jgi:hypothetical protein
VGGLANSLFDILGDVAMKRLAPILITLSGKKKDKKNKMSVLHVTNKKYKEQLKDDPDMKRLYDLLADAGIDSAFLNLYGQDGVFDFHRDNFLSLNSNCMPEEDALQHKNRRFCHKSALGKISFEMCKGHEFMCELTTKCYGMGLEGRGVTMMAQHKAERGADVEGWDLTLVIDCTKEEHERLQELIALDLAKDRLPNRPDLGKGVDSGECWDLGVYLSEIGKLDAKPETKQLNKYALNLKNKDGLESKWQHAGKKGGKKGGMIDAKPETKERLNYALNPKNPETKQRLNYDRDPKNKDGLESKWQHAANTLVDDGSGMGTTVRACVKGGNTLIVDDGSGNGAMVRPCNKQESCITCNVARRTRGSDKCSPCALAVMAAFFGT